MSIVILAEPIPQSLNTLQHMEHVRTLHTRLRHHANQICALAISSNSSPVWVNSFGPIAFCGRWLQDGQKSAEMIDELRRWSRKTGWPVSEIISNIKS